MGPHELLRVKSADCARETGAWLALCADDGKLKPISEEERIGDDPGHAFLLALWTIVSDDPVSLIDVARLNIALNSLGFLLLASFLFAVRAYPCDLLFMYLGPIVYLKWIGVAPHWGVIGVASMAAVLPYGNPGEGVRLSFSRLGQWFVGLGLLGLASASLVREAIGTMVIVTVLCAIGFIALRRRRSGTGIMRPCRRRAPDRGGILGALCRHYGARRDVRYRARAARATPRVFGHSLHGARHRPEFVRNRLQRLGGARPCPEGRSRRRAFFAGLLPDHEDLLPGEAVINPAEVVRIYVEKARLILSDPVVEPGLPLGIILLVGLCHLVVARAFDLWSKVGFPQGARLQGAALVFICFFCRPGDSRLS